ncbi:hypothetical protein K501DRAFT_338177 [Backusella circina FSU 941]|nr:hypothetical protein K501DRAFT_338177 [Backusella circina FSU 941]
MLLQLPQEIIVKIARKLQFNDKLTLALTCQALNDLISTRCLYEQVMMKGDQEDSEFIIKKFKENQLNCHQVQKLYYHMTLLSDDFFIQFPEVFPNITRYVDISPDHIKKARTGTPTSQLIKWKDTLEYYSSTDDWFKMASLMQSHTFSRLSFLHLSCSSGRFEGDIRHGIQYHECIKNAPLLKNLHLDHCVITLDLVEVIHTNCVHLQTFKIKKSLFRMDVGTLPLVIVPARQLSYFEISSLASFIDQNCVFLNYIIEKYTHLKQLIFNPIVVYETDVLRSCYPDIFKHQSNTFNSEETKDSNDSRIETLVKKIALTQELYRSEATRFLSRLPDTISKLEVNGDMFDHLPESLGQTTLKSVDLTIQQRVDTLPVFSKSGQLTCLKKLTCLKNLELHLSPSLHLYNEGVASITAVYLKTFIVEEYDYTDVNLGWLLACFPLLEELQIYATKNAVFIEEKKTQAIYLRLKKLSINTPMIHDTFLGLLGILAPNIKELSLHISNEDVLNLANHKILVNSLSTRLTTCSRMDYVWDVTAFDLDLFHLFFIKSKRAKYDSYQRETIYYNVKVGEETKELVFRGGNILMSVEAYERKKLAKFPKVTILCHKVKKIELNNGADILQSKDGITMVEKSILFGIASICNLELL